MRASGPVRGSDGVEYYILSDAAEILGWSEARVARTLEIQTDPNVVKSVLRQLPPARGTKPGRLVPVALVEAAAQRGTSSHDEDESGTAGLDGVERLLAHVLQRIDELDEAVRRLTGKEAYIARERAGPSAATASAFAAAVEAQEAATARSANERRRLRAEQERLAAEEERIEIEERERKLLLAQLREFALDEPPSSEPRQDST